MSVVWMAIGGGIVVWAVMRVWLRRSAAGSETLGTVSEQWLAEHRLNRTDIQR
jgi:hypothetical protein